MGQSKMSFPRQVYVLIHVNTWQFTNEMNMWDYKLLAGACLTEVISNRGMAVFFSVYQCQFLYLNGHL